MKKVTNKKKIIIGIVIGVFALVTIFNVVANKIEEKKMAEYIESKGIYLLDVDNTPLDLTNEGLEKNESYLVAVFDLKNKTDNNWEDSFFSTGLSLSFENNSYEPYGDYGIVKEFLNNSGYEDLYLQKINAHSTKRVAVAFKINLLDINDDTLGKINIAFGDKCVGDIEFAKKDIRTFKLFDEIIIDLDGESYQISRSIVKKVKIFETINMGVVNAYQELNYGTEAMYNDGNKLLNSIKSLYNSPLGVSITSQNGDNTKYYYSMLLPEFDNEKVNEVYPEVAELITEYGENLEKICSAKTNVSYEFSRNQKIVEEINEFFENNN